MSRILKGGWIPSEDQWGNLPEENPEFFPERTTSSSRFLENPFPVREQVLDGSVPCCVPCAVVGAMECVDATGGGYRHLSSLFLYYTSRGSTTDQPLPPLQIGEVLSEAYGGGVCRYEKHGLPLDLGSALIIPSNDAIDDARNQRIAYDAGADAYAYRRVSKNVSSWELEIDRGHPVIFGFWFSDQYLSDDFLEGNDSVLGPDVGEIKLEGHCCYVDGFDRNEGLFRVRDSWGAGFADEGHWWLPYSLVETDLIEESWKIYSLTY